MTRQWPALRIPELVEWRAREVFRDKKLGAGEYALLLGATFQAAGPHAARGGVAELSGAGGRGCWQSWGAAAELGGSQGLIRRYTCRDKSHLRGRLFNVGVLWKSEVVEEAQPEEREAEPWRRHAEPEAELVADGASVEHG